MIHDVHRSPMVLPSVCALAAALSLVAILRMPYADYTFLRCSVCAIALIPGITLVRRTAPAKIALGLAGALVTAAFFNPIVSVAMRKESWRWFGVGAALVMAACAVWTCPRRADGEGGKYGNDR